MRVEHTLGRDIWNRGREQSVRTAIAASAPTTARAGSATGLGGLHSWHGVLAVSARTSPSHLIFRRSERVTLHARISDLCRLASRALAADRDLPPRAKRRQPAPPARKQTDAADARASPIRARQSRRRAGSTASRISPASGGPCANRASRAATWARTSRTSSCRSPKLGKRALLYSQNHTVDPEALCVLGGIPRHNGSGLPFEMLHTPQRLAFTYNYNTHRRVSIGEALKLPLMPRAPILRHAIAHWEGDTLVIETVGLRDSSHDKIWLDENGNPTSDADTRGRALDTAGLPPLPARDDGDGSRSTTRGHSSSTHLDSRADRGWDAGIRLQREHRRRRTSARAQA